MNKISRMVFLCGFLMCVASFGWAYTVAPVSAVSTPGPNQILLSEPMIVYTNGTTVLNHPEFGFHEVSLPTVNLYKGAQCCYIACYSRRPEHAVYSVGDDIYVIGQVRIAGKYAARICEPTNFSGKDISAEPIFKTICSDKVSGCEGNQCWAGGDTGGWFGL